MKASTIFLYGPSGSGKSTTGQLLAQNLDLPFYDLDVEITRHIGKSVPEIFAREGEPAFRQYEHAELQRILSGKNETGVLNPLTSGEGRVKKQQLMGNTGKVIALGGGTLLDSGTRRLAETNGEVLLLYAPVEVLTTRLTNCDDERPLLNGNVSASLPELLARRAGHYASFPLKLDTSPLTPEQAAWQAHILLGLFRVKGMNHANPGHSSAYDIKVIQGGLAELGTLLINRGLTGSLVLVSDEHVGRLYAKGMLGALHKSGLTANAILIPPGERHKTMDTVSMLWEAFLSAGLERGSTVIALGGGVVSDLAGFAAATFLRGVRWVVLPTSLLGMADASLGGKTGADLPQGKNLVGAFHPPSLVLADPDTLLTLPLPELRSGLAEVVKHGIIADPELFERCASLVNLDKSETIKNEFPEIVRRAMAVKIQVIEEDPFEQGRRAALNLGHTIGHAVELASGYILRHGEAVAIGMVVEARLAERIGLADTGLAETIAGVLQHLGLPTVIPPGLDREVMVRSMGLDKKRAGGKLRFALPVRIGEVKVGVEIDTLKSGNLE
ncbi:MAG: 3-dehydroquinate synthase [Chloroflexi bacterium]|nr:3-dehydroquinate synthase [Chloroflexota bacterium]